MTIQPARHECHTCCPLQAEKPRIQPVVGNTHVTHVGQVVSSFQKILRGSQLTWYNSVSSSYTVKTKPRFGECYTCFGCETKTGVERRVFLFFKIRLCSAIPVSLKRSRRELSIGMAENRSTLKDYQNTLPPFWFHTQNRYSTPQNGGFVFTV